MRTSTRSLLPLLCTLSLACSSEEEAPPDAGPVDTGVVDSGTRPGPVIRSFLAAPEQVVIGTSVQLSYQVETATAVLITRETSAGTSPLLSSANLSGTVDSGALLEATTFRLRALGAGAPVERTVRVEVQIPEITILDFSASPNPATPGAPITVTWQVMGAERIRLRTDDAVLATTSTEAGQGQRRIRAPARSTKLVLEASTRWRTRTQAIVLSPRGSARVFDFAVEPSLLREPQGPVRLRFEARGDALSLYAGDAPIGGVPAGTLTGSVTVPLGGPTLYTLRVEGGGRTEVARRIAVPGAGNEVEPNDQKGEAQGLVGGVFGRSDQPGDVDFYRLVLGASGHLYVDLTAARGDCSGLGIKLIDAQGREWIERDAGEGSACPRLDPHQDPAVRGLPAGEYFLRIDGRRGAVDYLLATLVVAGRCGDGLLEGQEQCDDGGARAGDGCSATCTLELTQTFTFPGPAAEHADALGAREVDYYRVVVTDPTVLSIETGVPGLGECLPTGGDTRLVLYDEALRIVGSDDDTLGLCAALQTRGLLAAGSYFVEVRSFDPGSPIAAYTLGLRGVQPNCGDEVIDAPETCDDGNTTGGDGCGATCVIERISPSAPILIPLHPGAVRRVEVEVTTPGQSITATTSNGQGGCDLDTRLILVKDGLFLGYDSGGAGCAHLRPRVHAFATNLAPGIYQLLVVGDGTRTGTVTLEVSLNDPACGNGIVETLANEFCDDGNRVDNDGCSLTCERVLGGVAYGPGGPPTVFSGTIDNLSGPINYGLELSAPGHLFAEVGLPTIGQCSAGGDPTLLLTDLNGGFLAFNDDFNGLCSAIKANLDAGAQLVGPGSYLLQVAAFSLQPIPQFQLQIELRAVGCGNEVLEGTEQCDDGNLAPGDGCSEVCVIEP